MSRYKKSSRAKEGSRAELAAQQEQVRAATLTVALFFGAALIAVAGIVGGMRIYSLLPQPPRAVIVDQLSLTAPNPDFIERATEMLEAAGYAVDYVPGEEVTVDYYRSLPKRDYELVLLRTHASRRLADGELTDDSSLFTSEGYSPRRHVQDQRDGRLSISRFDVGDHEDDAYFGIPADFITSSMDGSFTGATVVLMGCDVLRGERLAGAFVEKGAGAVVGWDGPVSASHTDAATLNLLEHLLNGAVTVQQATEAAMAEVGPDPFYESGLLSYPPEG